MDKRRVSKLSSSQAAISVLTVKVKYPDDADDILALMELLSEFQDEVKEYEKLFNKIYDEKVLSNVHYYLGELYTIVEDLGEPLVAYLKTHERFTKKRAERRSQISGFFDDPEPKIVKAERLEEKIKSFDIKPTTVLSRKLKIAAKLDQLRREVDSLEASLLKKGLNLADICPLILKTIEREKV